MEGEKNNNKRRSKKILSLLFMTGLSAIILIVGTYAWFVGTSSAKVSNFELSVGTGDELLVSLDGDTWSNELNLNLDDIENAYVGNTNHLPGDGGLVPISTNGEADSDVSRLILYGKSSITSSLGGFRIMSQRIDNYTSSIDTGITSEQDGYLVFDLFIKSGDGASYISEYNLDNEEAIYLDQVSSASAVHSGDSSLDYGLANSVRVAFMQVGRVNTNIDDANKIQAISCNSTDSAVTSLCGNEKIVIWEPNDTKHDSNLISYYNKVCKSRESDGTYDTSENCTNISDGVYNDTYVINDNISSSDNVDIYDGLNGFTVDSDYKLSKQVTFTDTKKMVANNDRESIFSLAANSITKVRVYIYLEGQDVDNYDLISLGKKISVNFGFTKDKYDLESNVSNG